VYPQKELTLLAAHQAALRRRIAARRAQVAIDFGRVAQPLEWLDRMLALWRRVPPIAKIAAVPLGLFVQRTIFPRRKTLSSLLRWGPVVFGLMRGLGGAVKAEAAASKTSGDRG
jgi:hypothetical protein